MAKDWKRRGASWTATIALAVPALYVLSAGPAWQLASHFKYYDEFFKLYDPLVRLAEADDNNTAGALMKRYFELWDFCIWVAK